MDTGRWITSKRLRAHGLLLAIALWSVYLWNLGTPGLRDRHGNLKGTDFLHFYTLGIVANEHHGASLYDISAQSALVAQRVPQASGIRYLPLYPPQVSIIFVPFSHLWYGTALGLWWTFSAGLYAACCFIVWRLCPNLKRYGGTVAILATGFPAFFHLIAWGQTSALALGCFTIFFLFVRQKRKFLAGLALGCLVFKPQLGLAAAIVFLACGEWEIIFGTIVAAVAELAAGVLYYGIQPLRVWLRTLWHVREMAPWLEPRLYQTHCLRTFWAMLVPWSSLSLALYGFSGVIVVGWTVWVWRHSREFEPRLALLLLATVLISPHLTVYDLVILAPAFLLLADWLLVNPRRASRGLIGTMLYLLYLLPLVGPLSYWTHVQLSVIAMVVLCYLIWKELRSGAASLETAQFAKVQAAET
ncbi:MAG TPA: glycosyltransferase family 87 protein [Candidatus Sulfotelmatobacter sp.]|nr:glycosyltransferase family 87 protein [Candidatus Sulfotelmatobacter sp.]